MKKSKLTILLIIIIIGLIVYILYDKGIIFNNTKDIISIQNNLIDEIELDYMSVELYSDGNSYIKVLSKEEINNLDLNSSLKERLIKLYDKALLLEPQVDFQLKGYKIKVDDKISKIRKYETEDNIYIIFIKENGYFGVLNYTDYYDLLSTEVLDNYKNIKNVVDLKDGKIYYQDGSNEYIVINYDNSL